MTADEVVFAGGKDAAAWYYYNSVRGKSSTGSNGWLLLSPYLWNGEYDYASVFYVQASSYGRINEASVTTRYMGVRPVLSLKSCVKYSSGNGSVSDPYTIKETTSGC